MRNTSARLLSLLSLLQTRRDWPGGELAERLDVSARTVRRDVDRLRELGYPIAAFKGPDGGYRLDAGARLPPLLFDDDQAVALAIALRMATGAGAGAGIEEAAARALATVRQVMPARLRHRIDALEVTAVPPPGAATADSGVLTALGAAVHAREVLRFDYGDAEEPRRVEPHHLVARGGRWYLLAWDLDRADWRTFRADRMRPRTPTGPRFTPRDLPGDDVAAFVTARFRGAEAPARGAADWPCRGDVVLGLPASAVAPYARDGLVEPLTADRCRLTLGSWSWPALAAALAQFDTTVEVIGPPALKNAFAALARRFAATAGQ
ncbi:helix-turn-helix transcriptional regulator [Streptomyces sp. CBMA29]|uniref:helix-turn-helix transcriptional regulator n=1 Tax=Streptomyces sp. CBMA29 TaxID=1896314 RepID=UPI0016621251|nr:WYL domain-containing protein [Streptomyces sp. CBMA29]MBD0739318.1 transcriptional regulator [Streptomyces sp. CBMA29]